MVRWDINERNAHELDDETSDSENNSDTFSEIDPDENSVGNLDTMLDDKDVHQFRTLCFAPGEGQRPINLLQDKDAEYLSFPTMYCGERMNTELLEGNKIHYADLCKWELRNVDRRVANNIPNLFFKAKKLQIKQVAEKGNLAVKRVQTKGNIYTAGEILDIDKQTAITHLDEGYYIFRTIRNSPPYLDMCKKRNNGHDQTVGPSNLVHVSQCCWYEMAWPDCNVGEAEWKQRLHKWFVRW